MLYFTEYCKSFHLLYLTHSCNNLLKVVFIPKGDANKAPHEELDPCGCFPDAMILILLSF